VLLANKPRIGNFRNERGARSTRDVQFRWRECPVCPVTPGIILSSLVSVNATTRVAFSDRWTYRIPASGHPVEDHPGPGQQSSRQAVAGKGHCDWRDGRWRRQKPSEARIRYGALPASEPSRRQHRELRARLCCRFRRHSRAGRTGLLAAGNSGHQAGELRASDLVRLPANTPPKKLAWRHWPAARQSDQRSNFRFRSACGPQWGRIGKPQTVPKTVIDRYSDSGCSLKDIAALVCARRTGPLFRNSGLCAVKS